MIYFIKTGEYIKVGYTKDKNTFKVRLRSYQTSNPHEVEVLNLFEGCVSLEKDIINYFIKFHKKGEWFNYAPTILDYAKNPFLLPKSTIWKPTNETARLIMENLDEIISEYKKGHSLQVLAEKFHINRGRLSQYLPKELKRKKNKWFSLRKRETNPKNKRVTCLTTNEEFFSASEAARFYNTNVTSITKVCRGERKHFNNLVFIYK